MAEADALSIVIDEAGLLVESQRGTELWIEHGQGVVVLNQGPAGPGMAHLKGIALIVPRATLAPYLSDGGKAVMRLAPRDAEALQLLIKYVSILCDGQIMATPELRHLVLGHIYDLMVLVLGPGRGDALAASRSVRTARLRAVKADILDCLGNADLTVTGVARRHGMTPRYVHMLFEGEGATFSEYVLEQRLVRARKLLSDIRFRGTKISSVAYAVGFGDLSYFNRTFRRRFGLTPSALRRALAEPLPDGAGAEPPG